MCQEMADSRGMFLTELGKISSRVAVMEGKSTAQSRMTNHEQSLTSTPLGEQSPMCKQTSRVCLMHSTHWMGQSPRPQALCATGEKTLKMNYQITM